MIQNDEKYSKIKNEITQFFKDNCALYFVRFTEVSSFALGEFTELMAKSIPSYYEFYDADCFMAFFIDNIESFELEQIKNIRNIYQSESQCTSRRNHSSKDTKVREYINKLENGKS